MTVFIVEMGSYEMHSIAGVFSSLELAKAAFPAEDWAYANGYWSSISADAQINEFGVDVKL